jgi:hypothetical protein
LATIVEGIELEIVFALDFPRQAGERQAQSQWGVTGQQEHLLAFEFPTAADPASLLLITGPSQGQGETNLLVQPLIEETTQSLALEWIGELVVFHREVHGQLALAMQVVLLILESRHEIARIERECFAQRFREAFGIAVFHLARLRRRIEQRSILPEWSSILAPEEAKRPARQRFPRIPFALAVMHQTLWCKGCAQFLQEIAGQLEFVFTERCRVPLRAFHVVDGDEGGFSAHRESHVAALEDFIHLLAERVDGKPLFFGVGLGHTRIFMNTCDGIRIGKLDFADAGGTRDRCCALWVGRTGERNVPFAGEEPRGRIEPDPTRARQEHFGPGM